MAATRASALGPDTYLSQCMRRRRLAWACLTVGEALSDAARAADGDIDGPASCPDWEDAP